LGNDSLKSVLENDPCYYKGRYTLLINYQGRFEIDDTFSVQKVLDNLKKLEEMEIRVESASH
jgi:hypothetical protein